MEHVYSPKWRYAADGQSLLTESQEHEDALLLAGWADTPAAFGIVTAPSRQSQAVPMPPVAAPAVSAADVQLARQVETLQAIAHRQAQDLGALQDLVQDLVQRLELVESAMTTPTAEAESPATDDPDMPGRRGRRS